jgi:hypothetical protein
MAGTMSALVASQRRPEGLSWLPLELRSRRDDIYRREIRWRSREMQPYRLGHRANWVKFCLISAVCRVAADCVQYERRKYPETGTIAHLT